jgi:hypothetical protein
MNAIQPKSEFAVMNYCRDTLEIAKSIEESFLVLGERLHRIKTEQLYRGSWESFAEFLTEAKLNEGTASKLITVYRTFVERYNIDRERLISAGSSSLYEVASLIGSKEDAEAYVEKAVTLRREDLREEIREAKAGAHEHQWEKIIMRRCGTCNKLERT